MPAADVAGLPVPGLGGGFGSGDADGGFGGYAGGFGAAMHPAADQEGRAGRLIQLVTTIVDPERWQVLGGPSTINSYSGLIAVSTTAQTHKKVERFLNMLREAAGPEMQVPGKVVR